MVKNRHRICREPRLRLALLASGRSVTVFADQLLELLILWFVWDLTHSSTIMAVATFSGRAPFWLFALYGATLTDRFGSLRSLAVCNAIAGGIATSVAVKIMISGSDVISFIFLSFALNSARSIEAAALTAATPLIVPKNSYQIANGWFDNAKRIGRLTAPMLSKWISILSPGFFIIVAGVVYFGMSVIAAYISRVVNFSQRKAYDVDSFLSALHVLKNNRTMVLVFSTSAIYALFHGISYFVVLPRLSFEANPTSPAFFGMLVILFGIGGIIANLIIANLSIRNHLASVACGMIVAGTCFGILTVESPYWVRIFVALTCGAAFPFQDVFVTCAIQSLSSSNIVARMHATWRLGCECTISLGILLGGIAVDGADAYLVGIVSGLMIVGIGSILLIRSHYTL